MKNWLVKNWWVIALNGLIAVIFGLVTISLKVETIQNIVKYFGLIILLSGMILIVISLINLKNKRSWMLWLLEGVFNLAVGIVILVNQESTLDLFMIFFGIWAIVLGIVIAIIGFGLKGKKTGKKALYYGTLFYFALGIMLFFNPLSEDTNFFKAITAIVAFLAGLIIIYYSIGFKVTFHKQVEENGEDKHEIDENLQEIPGDDF